MTVIHVICYDLHQVTRRISRSAKGSGSGLSCPSDVALVDTPNATAYVSRLTYCATDPMGRQAEDSETPLIASA